MPNVINRNTKLLAASLVILLGLAVAMAATIILTAQNTPPTETIRVACVGDSLTQSTYYPSDLQTLLGNNYTVGNFGAGSTTVSLGSETPYMNSNAFQDALDFQPDIVVIMLGTNDAQPTLHRYNTTFVADYKALVAAFQALESKPEIWVVLPPPIFSNQSGKISPEYFRDTIIPALEQAANETDLPAINVYSALANYPQYFPDGVHINSAGAQIIANEVYKAVTKQNTP